MDKLAAVIPISKEIARELDWAFTYHPTTSYGGSGVFFGHRLTRKINTAFDVEPFPAVARVAALCGSVLRPGSRLRNSTADALVRAAERIGGSKWCEVDW